MTNKSAEQLLKEHFLGKTLVKLGFSDEPLAFPREIIDLEFCVDEDGYPKILFELEVIDGAEDYDERLYAYSNEEVEIR